MSAEDNVEMVMGFFGAFGRGDLEAVIEAPRRVRRLTSPRHPHHIHSSVGGATARTRRSPGLLSTSSLQTVTSEPFEDVVFTASGDRVVVEGHNKGTVLATGKAYEHDWVMIFTIQDGLIVRFRMYYDPADIEVALAG